MESAEASGNKPQEAKLRLVKTNNKRLGCNWQKQTNKASTQEHGKANMQEEPEKNMQVLKDHEQRKNKRATNYRGQCSGIMETQIMEDGTTLTPC